MRSFNRLVLSALSLALGAALAGPAAAEDLLEVYELARASDPQLAIADASRRVSAEGPIQARAALLPQISGTGSFSDSDSDGQRIGQIVRPDGTLGFGPTAFGSDGYTRRWQASLNQSIYDHANWTRLRSQRALKSKSEADYEIALDALFTRVATAYFNALTAKSNLEAAEAEQTAVGRQLEQAEQRFEVGLTAITDVHEARARADSARANVILTQNQLNDAYEALAELTGKPILNVEPLDQDIPLALPDPADPDQWVDVALDESPTLASRRLALESAGHDVSTAKAGHLPTLGGNITFTDSATYGDGFNRTDAGRIEFPTDQNFEDTTIGVLLTVPIFEGGATQSRVRQAIAQRDVTAGLLEQDRRAVIRTTRNAYNAVLAGMSEIEARKQALVSAQSALEATQAGFEVGTRTIVDVLLSQQQLFAAQREYARARHQFIVSGLNLKQSAGVIDVEDIQAVNALLD
jgi:outer membrane protein